MSKLHVVMPGPMMPIITSQLEANFVVHKVWEAADPDAKIAEIADQVGGIATGAFHAVTGAAYMGRFPNLQIVSNFGVGYDNVDAKWAAQNGVIVTNTPDVLTEEVADTALGLMLMTVRELSATERYLRAGRWEKEGAYRLTPATLQDRKLGILGLGRIGKAIARRAEACGMPICYHNRTKVEDSPYEYCDSVVALAKACDVLMIVVPGGAATQHIINGEVLDALGPNGILINIGRGSAVDEQELIRALKAGRILSAGLDVFEKEPHVPAELIAMENVVLLPHVASGSIHTRNQMGQRVVDNLLCWKDGKAPLSPVAETPFKGW